MKYYKNFKILTICLGLILGIAGCDFISSTKEYFSNSKDTVTAGAKPGLIEKDMVVMKENTLARVGSWTISTDEFNDKLSALKEEFPDFKIDDLKARGVVLEEIINQQLLILGARQTGLDKNNDIVRAVKNFRDRLIVQESVKKINAGYQRFR